MAVLIAAVVVAFVLTFGHFNSAQCSTDFFTYKICNLSKNYNLFSEALEETMDRHDMFQQMEVKNLYFSNSKIM